MFKPLIGKTMEPYVDDMITKSLSVKEHVSDLHGTFDILRKFQMRLNHEKCNFKLTAGKFLSFMVSKTLKILERYPISDPPAQLRKCKVLLGELQI